MDYVIILVILIIFLLIWNLYRKVKFQSLLSQIDTDIILDVLVENNLITDEELKKRQRKYWRYANRTEKQRQEQIKAVRALLNYKEGEEKK